MKYTGVEIVDRKSQEWKNFESNLRGKKLNGTEVVDIGLFGVQGIDLVEYATTNEFGDPSRNIPPRPFLRSTLFVHQKEIIKFIGQMKYDIIFGKADVNKYLDRIGLFVQRLVQKRIKNSPTWAAPNSPKTIAMKGSSTPLVDTGRLRMSIIYRVRRHVAGKMIKAIAGM